MIRNVHLCSSLQGMKRIMWTFIYVISKRSEHERLERFKIILTIPTYEIRINLF